uniref:Uncharacterized protein n=1 Tax=Sphaerodactylus townsendi TaxID=933632 RepID=A0ACB8EP68_9SAUR
MLPATSQLSIKGAIETVLTWTGSKSGRQPPKDQVCQRSRDIFSTVVTPDRIPKFCIPSLEVDHLAVYAEPAEDTQETSLGNTVPGRMIQRPRATRSQSEWCIRRGVLGQETWCRREGLGSTDVLFSSEQLERAGDHSDPVTRAALSLPHLSKITTPYGFLTLGESPRVRRKESLFFGYDSAELRICLSPKEGDVCPSQHLDSPLIVHRSCRTRGKPSAENLSPTSQGKPVAPPLHRTPGLERGTHKCEKKHFRMLMKKHLPRIKMFRSNSAPADRFARLK